MFSIKTADLRQGFKQIANRVMQGEKILISRPKNENLVILTEKEYQELEQIKAKVARIELMATIKALKEAAENSGADEMSMEEIDAEIAAYRQEKRGLNAKSSH